MAKRIKIGWVFAELKTFGGVISAIHIINALDKSRFETKIYSYDKKSEIEKLPLENPPIIFSVQKLPEVIAYQCDIVVATLWTTAYIVRQAKKINKKLKCIYFIQDYEPKFMEQRPKLEIDLYENEHLTELDSENFQTVWAALEKLNQARCTDVVKKTYSFIDKKIVKTDWLVKTFKNELNINVDKVNFGLDLSKFGTSPHIGLSREIQKSPFKILGFARPKTPRRGFHNLKKIFEKLYLESKNIKISLFGTNDLDCFDLRFPYENLGEVPTDEMRYVYSAHDAFIDTSIFQGFGRPGLEAMACGCLAILSDSGGIREYAKNFVNSFIYSNDFLEDAVNIILFAANNPEICKTLIHEGQKTAQLFSIENAAAQFSEFILAS